MRSNQIYKGSFQQQGMSHAVVPYDAMAGAVKDGNHISGRRQTTN